ncbi:hypothetical protein V493_04146 [Pseudogymnoascus sp. VKM F-4281 (FW-2241)]|nr:hypothetical protein V493_04146 [Pseudogymnoascus sp. VKM F-4281 (FW-2241)]
MHSLRNFSLFGSLLLVLDAALAIPQPFSPNVRNGGMQLESRDLGTLGKAFPAMVNALEVMQSQYWSSNTWPTGIDWTSAVTSTHVSAALTEMAIYDASTYRNDIHKYFSQIVSFHGGEDVGALLMQKFDDHLWVVLEWLEAIKFINVYSSIDSKFDGQQHIGDFAHRSRIFWDLASKGYDTKLCGGGMVWTDTLAPYKNAITNQLYLSASIFMYLYFPGDNNPSPYLVPGKVYDPPEALPPILAHDKRYLKAAIKEYKWLSTSNMKNSQGLYTDGFHITGWTSPDNIGTGKCDARDETVYTYNQGVILSGLRGLWDATGNTTYLSDGYTLIKDVIAATGWVSPTKQKKTWSGLGSNGILQDSCDDDGTCSQDAQNFKGIFFHHLTLFCQPIALSKKETIISNGTEAQAQAHKKICDGYRPWILHNAQAAYRTRNADGKYGGWWNVGAAATNATKAVRTPVQPSGADVRNKGIPLDKMWRLSGNPLVSEREMSPVENAAAEDPNDRGRGRTVETQSGGLSVMRSLVQALKAAK